MRVLGAFDPLASAGLQRLAGPGIDVLVDRQARYHRRNPPLLARSRDRDRSAHAQLGCVSRRARRTASGSVLQLCTSGLCPVVPTGRSTVADCADKNPSCATWAANGECKNSGTSAACAHSCLLAQRLRWHVGHLRCIRRSSLAQRHRGWLTTAPRAAASARRRPPSFLCPSPPPPRCAPIPPCTHPHGCARHWSVSIET